MSKAISQIKQGTEDSVFHKKVQRQRPINPDQTH